MREIAAAVLLRGDTLLLGRRSPARRTYPDCWDVLGGHLEAGETPEAALIRELQEEIGLTPTRFALVGSLPEPLPELYGPGLLHFFAVTEWNGGEPIMLGDEHTELRWFGIAAACALPDLATAQYLPIFRSLAGAPN